MKNIPWVRIASSAQASINVRVMKLRTLEAMRTQKLSEEKMAEATHLNGVRSEALNRMERSERNYKIAFFSAFMIEGLFLVGFLLIANLKDPLHLLLLISTVASYTIIIFGLMALGAHVSRNTQTVLRAIELIEQKTGQDAKR